MPFWSRLTNGARKLFSRFVAGAGKLQRTGEIGAIGVGLPCPRWRCRWRIQSDHGGWWLLRACNTSRRQSSQSHIRSTRIFRWVTKPEALCAYVSSLPEQSKLTNHISITRYLCSALQGLCVHSATSSYWSYILNNYIQCFLPGKWVLERIWGSKMH